MRGDLEPSLLLVAATAAGDCDDDPDWIDGLPDTAMVPAHVEAHLLVPQD